MIGYLLAGKTDEAFRRLAAKLKQSLGTVERFKDRAHKTTVHVRATAPKLRIHHMVMSCLPVLRSHGSDSEPDGQSIG